MTTIAKHKHMKRLPCLGHNCSVILLTTPERRICDKCKGPGSPLEDAAGGLSYQPAFAKPKNTRGSNQ